MYVPTRLRVLRIKYKITLKPRLDQPDPTFLCPEYLHTGEENQYPEGRVRQCGRYNCPHIGFVSERVGAPFCDRGH